MLSKDVVHPTEKFTTSSFRGRVFPVPYLNLFPPDIREYEHLAWCRLTAGIRTLLNGCAFSLAVGNTTKPSKCSAIRHLLQKRVKDELQVFQYDLQGYEELSHPSSRNVAFHKAIALHELVKIPSVGADANFFYYDEKRMCWVWQTKLDRIPNVTEQRIVYEIENLHILLVEQKEIKIFWDVAMALVNEFVYTASNYIVVCADSLDEEEFSAFILDSLETGLFFTSNARGPLIEYLVELEKIKKIGFIPHEFFSDKPNSLIDIRSWMMEYSQGLGEAAINMIIHTIPFALLGMR